MARPTNEHHVHSDGYYSEAGEADTERMLEELADEIEQIRGVHAVWPEQGRLEVEYNGEHTVYGEIIDEVADWGCTVSDETDDWLEIRPE